jgi:fructose-1,6-bisphosphatase/inositol monophosphatase family enzyme
MGADARRLLPAILDLHDRIRTSVVAAFAEQRTDALSDVADDGAGDTIYAVDRVSEETLVEGLEQLARDEPLVLVAEGLPPEGLVLPRGTREAECRWRLLVDPIDGTRGLMYQKRPAWILTGVAPNHGTETRLRDIVLAVQTEIPLVKQHLCDQLWAVRGAGVQARRLDRTTGRTEPLVLRPSRAETTAHGFASVSRFFPGARDVLAAIDDEVATAVLGPPVEGKASCFEDQYISTGGQLYELMAGHDRYVADLRPLLQGVLHDRGLPSPLCCHPYDLCTILVAEELGLAITGPTGAPLDAPLDVTSEVAWAGYANPAIYARIAPVLRALLVEHGMLPGD